VTGVQTCALPIWYAYEAKGRLFFKCHRCGHSTTVARLIETVDPALYREMMLEDYVTRPRKEVDDSSWKQEAPKFREDSDVLANLKKVSRLPLDHPVRQLVDRRKIPSSLHFDLYSCPNFMAFSNRLVPGKFSMNALARDETRLLIPFRNSDGKLIGYQGRAVDPRSEIRYITIALADVPMIYGANRLEPHYRWYAFEGPIDSMFIPNSIAACGGDMPTTLRDLPRDNAVLVYDNERRHPQTIAKIEKAIRAGYRVCIWPRYLAAKDVNDMILSGLTPENVRDIIDDNSPSGLAAHAALSQWRMD